MSTEQSATDPESQIEHSITVSFLLVTHNSQSVLSGLILSFKNHPPDCDWELIVVDNASSDNTVKVLQTELDDAHITVSPTNDGFAAGVNRAAAMAQGRYYCVVNPDIEWDRGSIDQLVSCCDQNARIGAITPRLVHPDGRPQLSLRRFPTHRNIWQSRGVPWPPFVRRLLASGAYTVDYPPSAQAVEAAAAACLVIRAQAFDDVGGFDDEYFLYVEDTDFCKRLQGADWEVWCDPEVSVRHRWSGGTRHDRNLAAHHRNGMRRYFRTHHADKPIRNAFLIALLRLAGIFDWLYIRRDKGASDV